MARVDGTIIKINRGDVLNLTLNLTLDNGTAYTFQPGDVIVFSLYNKGALNKEAILLKTITVSEERANLDITLTSEETKIGDLINKPVDYWYEIELNNQYTVIGYDDDGAKILTLFPEGSKVI